MTLLDAFDSLSGDIGLRDSFIMLLFDSPGEEAIVWSPRNSSGSLFLTELRNADFLHWEKTRESKINCRVDKSRTSQDYSAIHVIAL